MKRPKFPARRGQLEWPFESPIRHYVWGVLLVTFGLFTVFGIWFIFAG